MDLYEHRVTMVEPGRFREYRQLFLEQTWPRLVAAGYRPLCLLNPTIGGTPEEVHSFVGIPSWDEWRRGQEIIVGLGDDAYRSVRRELIVNETARPKIPYSGRPLAETPDSDRRAVYGLRRWTIDPNNWERFSELTEFGVWPAMDAMGHRVLGNFHDAVLSDDMEVTNLAGYQQRQTTGTRHGRRRIRSLECLTDDTQAVPGKRARERHSLTRHTWVQLMNAHWPE